MYILFQMIQVSFNSYITCNEYTASAPMYRVSVIGVIDIKHDKSLFIAFIGVTLIAINRLLSRFMLMHKCFVLYEKVLACSC